MNMKAQHTKAAFLGMICMVVFSAFTMAGNGKKMVVSEKGYWVIESNIRSPRESRVHYYNNQHQLVHTETISGRKLKIENRKTLLALKEKTDLAVDLYEKMAAREPSK
jgi:hypothetical protein